MAYWYVLRDLTAQNNEGRLVLSGSNASPSDGDIRIRDVAGSPTFEQYNDTLSQWETVGISSETSTVSNLQLLSDVAAPVHNEGLIFYDRVKKTVAYYNDEADVTVNVGQELLIRVKNTTGSTITNGLIVYPSGVDAGEVTVGLADASVKSKSRFVGMVTHDIENNSIGYVTRLGEVSDVDTSAHTSGGPIYLSATTPGAFQSTAPAGDAYVIQLGAIKVVGVSGSVVMDPYVSQRTVEVTDTNGFPSEQRTGTSITVTDLTRTVEISPTDSMFHYYVNGEKYEKTSADSVVFANTEGIHYFYYDAETLTSIANPTVSQIDNVIRTKSLVLILYWDAANSESSYVGDERHGISMSPVTHAYNHFTRGAQYLSGLALGDINADASGNLDTSAQFSIATGMIIDEDLSTTLSSIASTVGLPIYYLDGVNANLRRIINTNFSVLDDITAGIGSTGRLVYNYLNGGSYSLATVPNNGYVLCHVFAFNGLSGKDQSVAVLGQDYYGTVAAARAAASTEVADITVAWPVYEDVPVATLIFQTRDAYSNSVKARIVTTDEGNDYVDWRTSAITQGGTPSNHGALSGLGEDHHLQYALLAGRSSDVTIVNAATYDLLTTDVHLNVIYTSTGAITSLTLPSAQTTAGRKIYVKDAGGNANTNNITIDTESTELIDGQSTYVINTDYGAVTLYSDGSNWFVI